MTTVGFIGLGIMGGPMAANLVKAGFDVIGYNRSRDKVDALISVGGQGADGVAGAVRGADIVITMVPDSNDVEAVTSGENGIFANAKEGTLYIDMSSIRPDVSARVAELGRQRGLRGLDARVRGGGAGGKTIIHGGPAGAGETVKAANQLIVAGNIELVAEAIVFLEAYGVDMEAALEVLGGGLAGSTVLARKGASMLAGEFSPGFRLQLHHK